ncbi:MAG: hypothetical protein GXX79_03410 [Actinomycetales bacterium]|mgnify:CR=1 FL=1|nr:hypothetical protein [Actinomycetales bacterium]
MTGATHRLLGMSVVLGLAVAQGWSPLQAGAGTVIGLAVSGGRLSPDMDQFRGWRLADRVLPDEALGQGGPMRHRGLTHWWGLPILVAATVPVVPPGYRWLVLALLAGWCSHLLGDFLFGRADARSGRGPGIPLAPWWGHVGLGLDTGGGLESLVRSVVLPAAVLWQSLVVMHADRPLLDFLSGVLGD